MSGLVFFRTESLETVVEFYTETVGATVWLEQPGCTILEHDDFRVGFCEGDVTETCGIVTFVYDDRNAVEDMYEAVEGTAEEPPHENATYDIYQFFAEDPDGRTVEFQTFLQPV
jgi:predicted lactoylglutathione lyase